MYTFKVFLLEKIVFFILVGRWVQNFQKNENPRTVTRTEYNYFLTYEYGSPPNFILHS
jgi:hypothetical protein